MAEAFETGGNLATIRRGGYSFDLPDYTEEILKLKSGEDFHDTILEIIRKHEPHRERMVNRFKRYKTDVTGVPIFQRKYDREVSLDNRINNDYFSEIVDIKTGYFAGKQASYSYDADEENYKLAIERITEFLERNRIANINMETTKHCAIAGYAARLLYLDTRGRERIMYLPGHQAILLNEDGDITETEFAIRYYGSPNNYIIHFYDAMYRYKFQQDGGDLKLLEKNIHGFKLCPLFGYANNDELMGDADKVLSVIDAIDRVTSDVNSEIEAFRMAYLLVMGYRMDQAALDNMKKNGALNVSGNAGGEKGEVKYLTKDLNDKAIQNHLKWLHDSIYRGSKTPDLSDEAFAGQQSGVALKFKLTDFEAKCASFEQKFRAGDTRMFEIMATKWEVENLNVNPYSVYADFKRNFPQDLLYEAQVLQAHGVRLSQKTVLGLIPSIDDVQYEIDQINKEEEERISSALNLAPSEEEDNELDPIL